MSWPAGEAALEAARRPDGTWGYRAGDDAYVEPTALALLALAGPGVATPAGLEVLIGWQRPDGAFPSFPGDPDPSWTTSFAVLALLAWGRREAADRGRAWLAGSEVPRLVPDPADRMRVRRFMHIDPALPGSAWYGETSPWVEPTAMAGLARLAPPVAEPDGGAATRAALVAFLADRRAETGGWNYGNPFAFGSHLVPLVIPTAKALLALRRAGEGRPEPDLAVLRDRLEESPSRVARAWAALALLAWRAPASEEVLETALAPPGPGDGVDALALGVLAARVQAGSGPAVWPTPRREGGDGG